MFTGIIETLGEIVKIEEEGSNIHFTIQAPIAKELKIDQSVAHNGVCLTVVAVKHHLQQYTVTAIHETLLKTSLGQWKLGSKVNIERSMPTNARIDGHFVQGHVDTTASCIQVDEVDGSWYYKFSYPENTEHVLVNKGSVCIDGTSLTVVEAQDNWFSVAIIPYTYEHTVFNTYQIGTKVNIEFDVIGKYIAKLFKLYQR